MGLDDEGKHRHVPAKLGWLLTIKLHRPREGTPVTAHLGLRADGQWYALIGGEPLPQEAFGEAHPSHAACSHPAMGLDGGLQGFLADSAGALIEPPRPSGRGQQRRAHGQRTVCRRVTGSAPSAAA